jgi:hypothetical protein
MKLLYYVLVNNEIGRFTDITGTVGSYPMYFENVNHKIEMKNVREGWLLIEGEESQFEIIDKRSEIRKVEDCVEALRIAAFYEDWADFDAVQKSKRYEQLEIANALTCAAITEFEPVAQSILKSLREAEKINSEGGPGSRKQVTEILNRVIVDCGIQFHKILKFTEAI